MTGEPVNFRAKLARFDERWSPRVVAQTNDYQLELVKVEGDFVWHDHPDTDEVFIALGGAPDIELGDRTVSLGEGEMFVVPKGVAHRPRAAAECHLLLVEPRGVVNTGDAGGDLTAESDVWV